MNKLITIKLLVVTTIISLLIGFAVGVWFQLCASNIKYKANYDSHLLYSLRNDIDLMEYVEVNFPNDKAVNQKAENILALQLFMISLDNPKISKLQTIPLDALCRSIKFESINNFKYLDNAALTTPVLSYLNSISKNVEQTIQIRSQTSSNVLTEDALRRNRLISVNRQHGNVNIKYACG